MRLVRRPLFTGAFALAALAAAVPSGAGAADWSRPFDLTTPSVQGDAPSVGIDDTGRSLTAWVSDVEPGRIQMRVLAADKSLGAVTFISPATGQATVPLVAMNGAGTAAIAYDVFDGSVNRLQLRVRSDTGKLEAAQTVSPAAVNVEAFEIGIDDAGNVLLAWQADGGIGARLRGAGGTLGPTTEITAAGQQPQVAVNGEGDAVVVWVQTDFGSLKERFRPAGGTFGATAVDSVPGQGANAPDVAIDDSGRHVMTWEDSPSGDTAVEARARTAAGVAGPVRTIQQTGTDSPLFGPRIAVDGAGLAGITYQQQIVTDGSGAAIVRAAVLKASNAPTTPVNMTLDGVDGGPPVIAIDDAGRSIVAWSVNAGADTHILARPLTAAGVIGRRTTVSELSVTEDQPAIARNGAGAAVLAWRGLDEFDPRFIISEAFMPAP